MKVYDIDNIKKLGDNFDFTTRTFIYNSPGSNPDILFGSYKVQRGEEMRIDLICNSIYGNLDKIDLILNVNNISNPLNIKEGSIIIYPINGDDFFRYKEKVDKETTKILSDPNRSVKKDKDRETYQNNNQSIPPTILQNPSDPVAVNGGVVQIGNNLFNR